MPGRPHARVLIIGGGIGGACVAYHLAKLGVDNIHLLERAQLSSGTTWHSTGNMETYRADPLIFDMVRYAAALYPAIAAAAQRDIGWRVVGRVMYTDREERWALMRHLPELGRARGIDIERLSPEAVQGRLPIIATEGLLGGLWIPSDARVNPTDAVSAIVHLARACGTVIRERCPVLDLSIRNGSICGVITEAGEIDCDTVVLAGGLWSGEIAARCGLNLPLHALEHQYLITQPFGVDRDLPLFLSFDDQLYGREEVGGLIVGSLDDEAIPVAVAELPQGFASSLLSERWDQFEPYMATAMRRFPVLKSTPVKMLLNGPESFTPDGQMLLGPVPGVSGLYAACGFNSNGMALAPAAGRYLAEWIVEGAPSADVAALDVRRFSAVQSEPNYLRERVREIPGYHCRLHAEDEDYKTARDIRRSPLHEDLAAEGATFASVNGWERALWLKQGDSAASWLDSISADAHAAREHTLLVDRSTDVKFRVVGPGLQAWLDEHAPRLTPGGGSVLLVALPGKRGEIEALVRMFEHGVGGCLLTASPDQETRIVEWLRHRLPNHFRARDETASRGCLELRGPLRASLLEAALHVCGESEFDAREDKLHDSTVVSCTRESAVRLWRQLRSLGANRGLRVGGHLSEEAIRIARGIPAFGREISPAMRIDELKGKIPRHVLVAYSTALPRLGVIARDVILKSGRAVGELTSHIRIPGWDASLALGRIDPDVGPGSALGTVIDGKTWPLLARPNAWQNALRRSF